MLIDTEKIKDLLESQTGYEIAKHTGILAQTINKYQRGEAKIENMTIARAMQIMEYINKKKQFKE